MMDYLVTVLKNERRLSLYRKKSLLSRQERRKSLNLLKMENIHDSLFDIVVRTEKTFLLEANAAGSLEQIL